MESNECVCTKYIKKEPVEAATTPHKKRLKVTHADNSLPIVQIKIEAGDSEPMLLLSNCETCKAPIDPRFIEQNLDTASSIKEKALTADCNSNNVTIKRETDPGVDQHISTSTAPSCANIGHCVERDTKQDPISLHSNIKKESFPTSSGMANEGPVTELQSRIKCTNSPVPFRHKRWNKKRKGHFHPYWGSHRDFQYSHFNRQRHRIYFNGNQYRPRTNNSRHFQNHWKFRRNSSKTPRKFLNSVDIKDKKDIIVLRMTSSPTKSRKESEPSRPTYVEMNSQENSSSTSCDEGSPLQSEVVAHLSSNHGEDLVQGSIITEICGTGEETNDGDSCLPQGVDIDNCRERVTCNADFLNEESNCAAEPSDSEIVATGSMIGIEDENFLVLDETEDDSNDETDSNHLPENEESQEISQETIDTTTTTTPTTSGVTSEMPNKNGFVCENESHTCSNSDDIEVLKEIPSDNDISCIFYKCKELHVCASCFVHKRKIKKDTDVICLGKAPSKANNIPIINIGDLES